MARQEHAREDLLAEATALVERAEFLLRRIVEPIVIGFRRNGAASVYFGQDEAYHFDSAGRLRRAFFAGRLYKADRGRLASLDRRRTDEAVELQRHDLTEAETAQFLDRMQRQLGELKSAAAAGKLDWQRVVPDSGETRRKIVEWLANLPEKIEIARSARVN